MKLYNYSELLMCLILCLLYLNKINLKGEILLLEDHFYPVESWFLDLSGRFPPLFIVPVVQFWFLTSYWFLTFDHDSQDKVLGFDQTLLELAKTALFWLGNIPDFTSQSAGNPSFWGFPSRWGFFKCWGLLWSYLSITRRSDVGLRTSLCLHLGNTQNLPERK